MPPIHPDLTAYDAGLLNDYGGGNVDWWWDYIRAELDRAHDHYAAQFEAVAKPDALMAEMLEALKATRNALDHLYSAADEHNRATAIGGKHELFNEDMEAADAASDSALALIAKAESSPSSVGGR